MATGFDYESIDACIAFVFQMDRRHVVTVEGLAKGESLNAVQQAMVDCHGSQCGFCTPGFVMALQGLAEAAEDSSPSEDDLRLGLSGNLCRCTGYEQILEAGRSLTCDSSERVAARYDEAPILADLAKLDDEAVLVSRESHASNGHPRRPRGLSSRARSTSCSSTERSTRPQGSSPARPTSACNATTARSN